MKYPLTAKLNQKTLVTSVYADNDEQALIEASFRVIDLATNNQIWAEGEITLSSPEGKVLETMPTK